MDVTLTESLNSLLTNSSDLMRENQDFTAVFSHYLSDDSYQASGTKNVFKIRANVDGFDKREHRFRMQNFLII